MTDTYSRFREKIQGSVQVITNCMTNEGVKVVIVWTNPGNQQPTMATGENLEVTMRRAVQIQEEYEEAMKAGGLCPECGEDQDHCACGDKH